MYEKEEGYSNGTEYENYKSRYFIAAGDGDNIDARNYFHDEADSEVLLNGIIYNNNKDRNIFHNDIDGRDEL